MKVKILSDHDYREALFGIGLSYGLTSGMEIEDVDSDLWERLQKVSHKLKNKNNGHNKFLETMTVVIDLTATRYIWQEFDTYRVGTTKQSESTIHTAMRKKLTQENFERPIDVYVLNLLNSIINDYKKCEDQKRKLELFLEFKDHLPEGFLQRRIVKTSYKTLAAMIVQRRNHKLPQWHEFILELYKQVYYPQYLPDPDMKQIV